jgi:hypothetical protein
MKNKIIELAQEAGFMLVTGDAFDENAWFECFPNQIERFAELVRQDEREACAEKAAEFARKWWSIHCDTNKHMETTRKAHDDFCALQIAIRGRTE